MTRLVRAIRAPFFALIWFLGGSRFLGRSRLYLAGVIVMIAVCGAIVIGGVL